MVAVDVQLPGPGHTSLMIEEPHEEELFVNVTQRLVRARSPNGYPERDVQPVLSAPLFVNSTDVARNSSIYPWFGLTRTRAAADSAFTSA